MHITSRVVQFKSFLCIKNGFPSKILANSCLLKNKKDVNISSVASLTSKARRDSDDQKSKPAPWPYKTKKFTALHSILGLDSTISRLDEHSKLIVVDGNLGVGKSEVAKYLAQEFDLHYMPEVNLDLHYITPYGYDLRELDSQMPEVYKSFQPEDYYNDPFNKKTLSLQILFQNLRCGQYIDALAHVLSTGQGVVLERSFYSDMVFMDAMYKLKHVSKKGYNHYYERKASVGPFLMKPHLVIYLDAPVDVLYKKLTLKNPELANTKGFTPEYLKLIETSYKQKYLKEVMINSKLLMYDWSVPGDNEYIADDIEKLSLEIDQNDQRMMADWRKDADAFDESRLWYTRQKDKLLSLMDITDFDVEELWITTEENNAYDEVLKQVPGTKYQVGFNKDAGDTGLLFKT